MSLSLPVLLPHFPKNLPHVASRTDEGETLGRATFLHQKVGCPFSEVPRSHHGHALGHSWAKSGGCQQ